MSDGTAFHREKIKMQDLEENSPCEAPCREPVHLTERLDKSSKVGFYSAARTATPNSGH